MGNMNEQGRDKKHYERNAKVAWYGVVGMVALLVLTTLMGC